MAAGQTNGPDEQDEEDRSELGTGWEANRAALSMTPANDCSDGWAYRVRLVLPGRLPIRWGIPVMRPS